MTDYSELRKLAEAATPGPWKARMHECWSPNPCTKENPCRDGHGGDIGAGEDSIMWAKVRVGEAFTDRDVAYMVAANPKAILELLDKLEQNEAAP